ncbi:MAG: tetratricopeptide repeat protein [candidate division Zixibacteria bacterium]|nr:tetratricopeptide repeat protein [candidate division Zixibacteria bacterium]
MKRFAIMTLMATILAIGFGCEKKTDLALRYEMEKALAKADRLSDKIYSQNKRPSDAEFSEIIENYQTVVKMIKQASNVSEVEKASADKRQAWAIADLARTRIGIMYSDRGLYDKAFESFKSAVDDPAISKIQKNAVQNYMASAKEKLRQYPEAASIYYDEGKGYLDIIVAQNPNMDALAAPIKAAQAWLKAGDKIKFDAYMDSARAIYRDIAAKYPKSPVKNAAVGKLAATYMLQDNYRQAIDILREAKDDSTNQIPPDVLLMIADIHLKNQKDYQSAEKTYREFIRMYPNERITPSAYLGLGLTLFEMGKYQQARETVKNIAEKAAAQKTVPIDANYLIALCLEKEGKWEQALGRFNLIQASFPGSEKAFEAALYIGNYYKTKGEQKLADESFRRAEEYISKYANPETSNEVMACKAMGYLVRCYTEAGNLPKAIEVLTELHEKHRGLPEGKLASLRLADLYENALHDNAKAAFWLDAFIQDNPDADNIAEVISHRKALAQ